MIMCLHKKHIFPRIALANKKVYKGVVKRMDVYKTPFQDKCVSLGKTYKGIFKENDIITSMFSSVIEGGYIHCFDNITSAKEAWFCDIIIECEIPKWTLYWRGTDGEIATRKLKYIKRIS